MLPSSCINKLNFKSGTSAFEVSIFLVQAGNLAYGFLYNCDKMKQNMLILATRWGNPTPILT